MKLLKMMPICLLLVLITGCSANETSQKKDLSETDIQNSLLKIGYEGDIDSDLYATKNNVEWDATAPSFPGCAKDICEYDETFLSGKYLYVLYGVEGGPLAGVQVLFFYVPSDDVMKIMYPKNYATSTNDCEMFVRISDKEILDNTGAENDLCTFKNVLSGYDTFKKVLLKIGISEKEYIKVFTE